MSALREAAQQALERLRKYHYGNGFAEDAECIADLEAALAQQDEPAQEPVAWRYKPMIGSSWSLSDDGYYISCKRDKGYIVDSLYTAPPQRKLVPLTAQELDGVIERHVGGSEITDDMYTSMEQFARAVEKASWEKHHG